MSFVSGFPNEICAQLLSPSTLQNPHNHLLFDLSNNILWSEPSGPLNPPQRRKEECRDVNQGRHLTIFTVTLEGSIPKSGMLLWDLISREHNCKHKSIYPNNINILERTRNTWRVINKVSNNNIIMKFQRERTMPIHWTNRAVAPAHLNPATYNYNQCA